LEHNLEASGKENIQVKMLALAWTVPMPDGTTAFRPARVPRFHAILRSKAARIMSTTTTTDLVQRIVATLQALETELRRAGIRDLSLFGSFARGDADAASDVDLAIEFDPAARMDLFRLTALESRIAEIIGRRVDLLPEPVQQPRLQANINRDRRSAF
jgi:uncharacterized protein